MLSEIELQAIEARFATLPVKGAWQVAESVKASDGTQLYNVIGPTGVLAARVPRTYADFIAQAAPDVARLVASVRQAKALIARWKRWYDYETKADTPVPIEETTNLVLGA